MSRIVPDAWMPAVRMQRIIVHWTAGTHVPSENDRAHYHVLIDAGGRLVRGAPAIGGRVAHTLNCNSGSIGVSLACMGGAKEHPFSSGKWPMTPAQWEALALVLADLCERYRIPVGPKFVLSHAEVQPNLGIKQKGKWDIARISFLPNVKGAKACGDLMRKEAVAVLEGRRAPPARLLSEDLEERDGGEPDDPGAHDLDDAFDPVAEIAAERGRDEQDKPGINVQRQTATYDPQVEWLQMKLQRIGYHEVGGDDGKWGGMTVAGVAAFKNDRGLPGEPVFDEALRREIAKCFDGQGKLVWSRPIAPERANITVNEIATQNAAAKQTWWQWVLAKWTALTTLAGGAATGVASQFDSSGIGRMFRSVREYFNDIPGWLWFVLIGLAGLALWKSSRSATESIADDKRVGRLS